MGIKRTQAGFSLLELMVVLAIIGTLATMAGPSLMQVMSGAKARSAAIDLLGLIRLGRSEAMRTGSRHMLVIEMGNPTTASDDIAAVFANAPGGSPPWQAVTSFSQAQMSGQAGPPGALVLVASVDFDPGVGLGPTSGYPIPFSYPYTNIRHASCSFCGTRGAIYFETDGSLVFSKDGQFPAAAPDDLSASLTVSPEEEWASATPSRIYAITLIARTGVSRVWSR